MSDYSFLMFLFCFKFPFNYIRKSPTKSPVGRSFLGPFDCSTVQQ